MSGGSAKYLDLQTTTPTELEVDEQNPSTKLGPSYIEARMAFSPANTVPGSNAPTALGPELEEVNTSVRFSHDIGDEKYLS